MTFIEDAIGTANTDETYAMPGMDIRDFVGTLLHWSDVIEVLDYEEMWTCTSKGGQPCYHRNWLLKEFARV